MFGGAANGARLRSGWLQQEEARKILAVVFDAALQNVSSVGLRGQFRRDGRRVGWPLLHDHLDATGGVIERRAFDSWMAREKVQALIQRYRVGIHFSDGPEWNSGRSDQVVDHPHAGFRGDLSRIL